MQLKIVAFPPENWSANVEHMAVWMEMVPQAHMFECLFPSWCTAWEGLEHPLGESVSLC